MTIRWSENRNSALNKRNQQTNKHTNKPISSTEQPFRSWQSLS